MQVFGDASKRKHLQPVIQLSSAVSTDETTERIRVKAWFDSPLTALDLPMRAVNAMERNSIYTVGDLAKKTKAELLAGITNFGAHSVAQCVAAFKNRNLPNGLG